MLDIVVRTDGVYDIFCGLCILDIIRLKVISDMRLANFYDFDTINYHNQFTRFYAYLLIVNGIVKIHYDYYLVTSIYGIESVLFFNEVLNYSLSNRGIINSIFSMFLCTYLILN
jgi:hypothetical protein